jgi:hypothetical protein
MLAGWEPAPQNPCTLSFVLLGLSTPGEGQSDSPLETDTMAANETHSLTANPSKDAPSDCARDTREGAQDDSSTVTQNNPPNHSNAAQKGSPAKFLQWLHPDTPLEADTLSAKWDYWYPRDMAEDCRPRDDPRPTWDNGFPEWRDAE